MATQNQETQTRTHTSAEEWGLTYPGLGVSTDDSENVVSEFTGMWPLKPDADLVASRRCWRRAAGQTRRENRSRRE